MRLPILRLAALLAAGAPFVAAGAAAPVEPEPPPLELSVGHAVEPDGRLVEGAEDDYFWVGEPFWLVVERRNESRDRLDLCLAWRWQDQLLARSLATLPEGAPVLAVQAPPTRGWPPDAVRVEIHAGTGEAGGGCSGPPVAALAFGLGDRAMATANGDSDDGGMPAFSPWPPPVPTDETVIPRERLAAGGAVVTLGDAAERLEGALQRLDYGRLRFYGIPGGFALATKLEQIGPGGERLSEGERWSADLPPRDLSLGGLLAALFRAPEGHYRVIVFLVTDRPIGSAGRPAAEEEAAGWLAGGVDRLPPEVAGRRYGPGHRTTAYVYQFLKRGFEGEPEANPDGAPSARTHLERSGILRELEGGR